MAMICLGYRCSACNVKCVRNVHDTRYYLTWDNCTRNCEPMRSTMLSTTSNPHDSTSWTLHGAVLLGKYTGGAALLFRDDAGEAVPHYAFVSDSNTAGTIMLATSSDGLKWTETGTFMVGRKECWDEAVAAGPQPERLSTGDYLMIYNIDTGFPYVLSLLVVVTLSAALRRNLGFSQMFLLLDNSSIDQTKKLHQKQTRFYSYPSSWNLCVCVSPVRHATTQLVRIT